MFGGQKTAPANSRGMGMRAGTVWLSIAAVGAALVALPRFGWCWGQHRFLSRQEIIDAAIEEALSRTRVMAPVPGALRSDFHDVVPYADRAAFVVANPACCRIARAVGDYGSFVPWWDRWCGLIPHNVRMAYTVRYRDEAGAVRTVEVKDNVALTSCGKVARD